MQEEDSLGDILRDQGVILTKVQEIMNETTSLDNLVLVPIWKIEVDTAESPAALAQDTRARKVLPVHYGNESVSSLVARVLFGKILQYLGQIHLIIHHELSAAKRQLYQAGLIEEKDRGET